jgi:hypothetical protein
VAQAAQIRVRLTPRAAREQIAPGWRRRARSREPGEVVEELVG